MMGMALYLIILISVYGIGGKSCQYLGPSKSNPYMRSISYHLILKIDIIEFYAKLHFVGKRKYVHTKSQVW